MRLDDYSARKTSDLYLEDLPYILHSSWAISKLKYEMTLNRYSHLKTFNSFGFCERLILNLKNGRSVLINNFPRNKEILGILDYKDFPKQDLPLFLKYRLHELIECQIKKPVVRAFYPNSPRIKEMLADTVDDVVGAVLFTVEAAITRGRSVITPPNSFADLDKLISHFKKHGTEFNASSESEYLNIANDIIQNGHKVEYLYKGELRIGYVDLMGANRKGEAKFAFVGTNNNGDITTLHTKSGKDFWKTLNSDAKEKIIKVKND